MNRKSLHKPFLFVALLCLSLASIVCSTNSHAQGSATLTPYRKAILDRYYLGTNSSIDGSLIINGTIGTQKLDFAIVLFSEFEAHTNEFGSHTNDASAHHTKFTNADETDPIFTNFAATNTYVKSRVLGGLVMPETGWASPSLTNTSTWHQVSLWTNENVSEGITYGQSNMTLNIPAARTANVNLVAAFSSSSTSGGGIDVEYAFFVNGVRTHTNLMTRGIVRTHSAGGAFGSVTIYEPHELTNGTTVDIRVRKYAGVSRTINFVSGTVAIDGYLVE